MPDQPLPDYKHPPVTEIIAAVQFRPLPLFGIREVIHVARALDGWEVVDTPPAIPPMMEAAPGHPDQERINIGFGAAPTRVILETGAGRWTGQVQQDRIAVHERKVEARPSFRHVQPKLTRFATDVGQALGAVLWDEPHRPDFVEVIYENRIAAADGGWESFADLGRVLRGVQTDIGLPPYDHVEQLRVAFSFLLKEGDVMAGRLRVFAEPQRDEDGQPVLGVRMVGRRFVQSHSVNDVLEMCHADIVRGFTAITTNNMHELWGRFQ